MTDFLIVGCGLFGSCFARTIADKGYSSLIIDRRDHIAGNCFTSKVGNIHVHEYGPHIFHTNSEEVWSFVNRFAEFNSFVNRPLAKYKDQVYSLPINMYTLNQIWGVVTPEEAIHKIELVRHNIPSPRNLEEWVLSQLGSEIYEKLIYGYTKKQWGKEPSELPSSIIRRLPVRFTYDNNYYNAEYQGIPVHGYTNMVEKILDHGLISVKLNEDFDLSMTKEFKQTVYSGSPDELFDYKFGDLEYRSLSFKKETTACKNFQGNAIINYTNESVPFTRIVEHKHFTSAKSVYTVLTKEYPLEWTRGRDPYYPINNERNNEKYSMYKQEAKNLNIVLGGRLGSYRYWDMDQVIASAISEGKKWI